MSLRTPPIPNHCGVPVHPSVSPHPGSWHPLPVAPHNPQPGSPPLLHLARHKPSLRLFGNAAQLILNVSYLPAEELLWLSKAGFASLLQLIPISTPIPVFSFLHPTTSCHDIIRCFDTKNPGTQTSFFFFFLGLYCCIHKTGWENC